MKSAEYWQKRAEAVEAVAWRRADTFLKDLDRISKDTENEIRKDIESWYARFAKNNQISLQEARKLLKEGDLEEFKWTVDKYIKEAKKANLTPEYVKKLENASAKFHISRLEAIETEMQQKVELLYKQQTDGMTDILGETLSDSYLRNAYEIQKGIGIGFNVAALSESKIKTLLSRPWTADGLTFKDRCWAEKENIVEDLQKILLQGMIKGDSSQTLTEQVKKRFGVSRYQAGRLIHTETTYFNAKAAEECYRDIDVDKIEIIETLDSLTCELCGSMDGKVIPISAFEPGVTAPPFHPNCRGTTAPYIEDDDFGKRIARDEDGQTYEVPANMTYEEWKESYIKRAKGRIIADVEDLENVSKSVIINMKAEDEIYEYFDKKYGIEIEEFAGKGLDLDKQKMVFAGIDDVLTKYRRSFHSIDAIKYNPRLKKEYGDMLLKIDKDGNRIRIMQIGSEGLGSYRTGVHETIHAIDYHLSEYNKNKKSELSDMVINKAIKELGLIKNGKEYNKLAYQIIYDLDEVKKNYELFAYAIETELADGQKNKLSSAILKIFEEEYEKRI